MIRPNTPASSTVRSWKIIVLVLIASNLLLGGFSYHLLRKLDRTYSELITGTVPLLNALQTLTAQTVVTMRSTGSALTGGKAAELDLAVSDALNAVAADRRLRTEVLRLGWASTLAPARAELSAAGEAFGAAATTVVEQAHSGRLAEATQTREHRVRPTFDRYLAAATKAADLVEAESLRTSETITHESSRMSTVVLGIASWPLILGLTLALAAAPVVAVLLLLLRGVETNESP
jgi:hypothetical protein